MEISETSPLLFFAFKNKQPTLIITVVVDNGECARMFTTPASGNLCILNTNVIVMTVHHLVCVTNGENMEVN